MEELDLEYISALTDAGLSGKAIEREPQGEQYVLNPTGYSVSNLKSKYLKYFYISAAQTGFGPQSLEVVCKMHGSLLVGGFELIGVQRYNCEV